jgi:hypothetical protein
MENLNREKFKKEVAQQHSIIRKNPKAYIPIIEKHMTYLKGNIIYKPGKKIGIKTKEGISAYLECIEFLKNQSPIAELIYDEEVSKAAQDHADDIGPSGVCDHKGTDDSTVDSRIERYVDWGGSVCENLDFGAETPEEVILSLIIEDGVPDRGHRTTIFQPNIKYIGVGVSEHSVYKLCTIIDYVVSITSYHKDTINKLFAKDLMPAKTKAEENNSQKKLNERKNLDHRQSCAIMSNLSDKFAEQVQIKGLENYKSVSRFPDDPDAPEDAISCKTKIVTKTSGKRNERRTTKTYTLQDGSLETVEIVEIDT